MAQRVTRARDRGAHSFFRKVTMSAGRHLGAAAVAVLATSLVVTAPQAALALDDPLQDGKAEGSGEYGLIGDSLATINNIYGVTVDAAGSIWYAVTDDSASADRGIYEYRPTNFDPSAGDYLGNGDYAETGGYLASAWEGPTQYANRDSTAADPSGGERPWAEPRGVITLADGGIAVSDTNGNVSTPPGTILFYDAEHRITGNAGVGGDQGCTQLAQGELAWGPYFTVMGDRLFAPYEGCNVVSVFDVPGGDPLYRLTGEGQTAGIQPNRPVTDGPGNLDEVYGVSTDGDSIITSDLGFNRATKAGMVQRWKVDDPSGSWELDTSFGEDGAIAFPNQMIYDTVVGPEGYLYVVPQTGAVLRYSNDGKELLDKVKVRDVPYTQARDLDVTTEGWIIMTAKGEHSLRLMARAPSPMTGFTGSPGALAGSVELAWDENKTVYGQAPVLDYVVERSADDGKTWELIEREPSLETSLTVTELEPGTYSFRVTAYSEAGRGDAATIDSVIPSEEAPAIDVSLTGKAPATPGAGEPIVWTATVTNAGNTPLADAEAVFMRGVDDAEETVPVGALDVGDEAVITVSTATTAEEVASLTAENAVAVQATDPSGGKVAAQATATVTLGEPIGPVVPPVDPPVDPVDPVDPVNPVTPADPPAVGKGAGSGLASTGGAPGIAALALAAILLGGGAVTLLVRARRTV